MIFSSLMPTPVRRVDLEPVEPKEKKEKLSKDQKVLLRAADVIEERGWCTGRLEDANGSVCMLGAINVAITGSARTRTTPLLRPRVFNRVIQRLAHVIDDPFTKGAHAGLVSGYNDWPYRTRTQVVKTLRRAAELKQ